jgi:hypothetical protein
MLRSPEQVPMTVARPASPRRTRPAPAPARPHWPEQVVLCAGTYRNGPAILGVTRRGVFLCSMPSGETRMRSVPLRQVLAVEEDVRGRYADVVVLTAHSTVTLTRVSRARAWEFCRAVRDAILTAS